MKLLYLLRHAKSSWSDAALDDHERPLAPRGKKDAQRLATYLRESRIKPALVLCSSARRTRETLHGIKAGLPDDTSVLVEGDLYLAGTRDVIKRLRRVPDDVPSVMVIGHNPTMQELALSLAGHGDHLARLRVKLPTGSLVSVTIPSAKWSRLGDVGGEVTGFVTPDELK